MATPDRERLREALDDMERVEHMIKERSGYDPSPVERTIQDAAHAVLEAPEVWVCEEHKSIRETKTRCLRWYDLTELGHDPTSCRMVKMFLVPSQPEETL